MCFVVTTVQPQQANKCLGVQLIKDHVDCGRCEGSPTCKKPRGLFTVALRGTTFAVVIHYFCQFVVER